MKIGNLGGRAQLIVNDLAFDVERASAGRFGPTLTAIYDRFDEFVLAVPTFALGEAQPFSVVDLGSPVPAPRQVFAVGLNYHGHAAEAGVPVPAVPAVFTKFQSSLGTPFAPVPRVGETLDWEVEIVVVLAREAVRVSEADAWSYVAGLAVGQDYSERTMQFAAGGQFSLGKSYQGLGPIGPWLTTLDELSEPDRLHLECWVGGDQVQNAWSDDMVFSIPALISQLSHITPLWAGDVIFSGTPAGVGITAQPSRFLQVGEVVRSSIEGLGTIENLVVAPE